MTTPVSRSRHQRHRTFDRTRRAKRFLAFLARMVTKLTGTVSNQTFTADNTTEELSITTHGHVSGDGPFVVSNSGGALPTGLTAGVLYFLNKVDDDKLKLALTREDAVNGTNLVVMSTNGTGTNTLKRALTDESVFDSLNVQSAETVESKEDVDDLG